MRPVRGAPKWEFNDWFDRYYEDTHVVEPPRKFPTPQTFYDALSIEEDRSPILKYMGLYQGESMAFPDALRGDE